MEKIKENMYAPVLIPTLCRYEHFVKLIDSLQKCKFADKTEIVIGLDYPAKKEHIEGYERINSYIDNGINGFRKVTVIKHKKNVGETKNISLMMNYIEEKYDKFILTEDDNIFANSFLSYINTMLEYYKESDKVKIICGFSYPVKWSDVQHQEIIEEQSFFSAWGYAMYIKTDKELDDYFNKKQYVDQFIHGHLAEKLYKKSKKNFCYFINSLWNDNLTKTDIGTSIYQIACDKYCVMPSMSLVRNEGWDGTGVNCNNDLTLSAIFSNQLINEEIIDWSMKINGKQIIYDPENEKIINKFFPPSVKMFIIAIVRYMFLLAKNHFALCNNKKNIK